MQLRRSALATNQKLHVSTPGTQPGECNSGALFKKDSHWLFPRPISNRANATWWNALLSTATTSVSTPDRRSGECNADLLVHFSKGSRVSTPDQQSGECNSKGRSPWGEYAAFPRPIGDRANATAAAS